MNIALLFGVNKEIIPLFDKILYGKKLYWLFDFKKMRIYWDDDNSYEVSALKRIGSSWFYTNEEMGWTSFSDDSKGSGRNYNVEIEQLFQKWRRDNENYKWRGNPKPFHRHRR